MNSLVFTMPKKPKTAKTADESNGLWIAPRHSIKGPAGERAWENRLGGVPTSTRFLELADIALGLKKPGPHKKKAVGVSAHDRTKTEPYSPK